MPQRSGMHSNHISVQEVLLGILSIAGLALVSFAYLIAPTHTIWAILTIMSLISVWYCVRGVDTKQGSSLQTDLSLTLSTKDNAETSFSHSPDERDELDELVENFKSLLVWSGIAYGVNFCVGALLFPFVFLVDPLVWLFEQIEIRGRLENGKGRGSMIV